MLLWFGGLRIGECLGLRRSDLHFTDSSTSLGCSEPGPHLHVVHRDNNPNRASAKSRNDRVVPVGAWVLAYYDRYCAERLSCPGADDCDFVFVTLFHPPPGQPMTASAVRQGLRSLSRRAGLGRAIHPHLLRHAMNLLHAGVDIAVLALWLGHESTKSTQAYIHADMKLKEQALARTTPAGIPAGRYIPSDPLLAFLENL